MFLSPAVKTFAMPQEMCFNCEQLAQAETSRPHALALARDEGIENVRKLCFSMDKKPTLLASLLSAPCEGWNDNSSASAHDTQLLSLGRYPYQVDSAHTPAVMASGNLPSSETVVKTCLASDNHSFLDLRQPYLGGDYEPLHVPRTRRSLRHCDPAMRTSVSSISK